MALRKSPHGKELTYAWEGFVDLEQVRLIAVPSTLTIPDDLRGQINAVRREWAAADREDVYDGLLWRFEGMYDGEGLAMHCSPTSYAEHYVLRKVPETPLLDYPSPIGVSTLQETEDGYLLMGVRGRETELTGLSALGSGFVQRHVMKDGGSKRPQRPDHVILRECMEETRYMGRFDLDLTDARVMGIVLADTHDTGIATYVPVAISHRDVELGSDEHRDLLFVPNDMATINQIIASGKYKGIKADEDIVGLLELYAHNRQIGNILR